MADIAIKNVFRLLTFANFQRNLFFSESIVNVNCCVNATMSNVYMSDNILECAKDMPCLSFT